MEGFEEREALLWVLCAVLKKKKKTLPRLSTHQEWPQPFVWGKSERASHAELLRRSAASPELIQPQFWKGHAVNPHVVHWAD